jgi:hypothetical protein
LNVFPTQSPMGLSVVASLTSHWCPFYTRASCNRLSAGTRRSNPVYVWSWELSGRMLAIVIQVERGEHNANVR